MEKLKQYLRKYSWYRWCEANDLKALLNKARGLKQKLSHDNLFDMSLGAILACVGLWLYLNVADMDKLIIIVVPLLFSWLNELVNVWQGQKKIMWIDISLRCLVGTVLYFIV